MSAIPEYSLNLPGPHLSADIKKTPSAREGVFLYRLTVE